MQIIIGCTDGKTYTSDVVTKAEILEEMSESEYERQMALMDNLFKDFSVMGNLKIMINGRSIYFNPSNIVWADLIIED